MRTNPVALIPVLGFALPLHADTVEPVSRLILETEAIMGVSGLEITPDGRDFTAVTDRGFWATGHFDRKDDTLSGVTLKTIDPIIGYDGFPVAARRVGDWADSEGLAIAPDGRTWVSFERWARVAPYTDGLTGRPTYLQEHPTFEEHADNWQLEAVAISPEGSLYAFSEKPLLDGFPVYRLANAGWVIDGFLPETDLFAIVGADFAKNGDLYLLERKLVVGLWWQSRIRRVNFEREEDKILWTGERGEFGNLEGIAVWQDDTDVWLTTVSDNNGSASEPTEFVEFRLIVAPDPPLDEVETEG